MISATALKASQCRAHSVQLRFRPPHQRIKQTSALAEREKQKMQLSHSLAEPRPPGIALRSRSKTANGPCSFAIRWLSLKVASDPKTKMNQRTARNGYLAALMFITDIATSSVSAGTLTLCFPRPNQATLRKNSRRRSCLRFYRQEKLACAYVTFPKTKSNPVGV